ncbi:MAG: hypothetical protein QNK14_00125, partial [Desulfobacterales bacterium]|nr:hypothetical protein [Desulfobacterales bacterium]
RLPSSPWGVPDGMDSGDMGKKRILNSCSSTNKPSYFRFGLRGNEDSAVSLLKEFPMEARTKDIATAQIAAVNAILSNIPNGNKLVGKCHNIVYKKMCHNIVNFYSSINELLCK